MSDSCASGSIAGKSSVTRMDHLREGEDMQLENALPPEIAADVEKVEVEAARAAQAVLTGMVAPPKPKKVGRPPKGACPLCREPLAVGKTCPCLAARLNAAPVQRPAWEPIPLDDLRERLQLLTQAGVESYEDGAIKITISQQARLAGAAKREDQRTRW